MAIDIKRLLTWLNQSKTQDTNNALWQLLKSIIGFVQENSKTIEKLNSVIPTGGADPNTVLHGANDPLFRQVATDDIEDAAITTDKIAALAVTDPKIAADAVITVKILDDNVTYAKIQNVTAASRLLGRGSASGAGNVEELTVGSGLAITGTVVSATGSGGTITGSGTAGSIAQWSASTVLTDVTQAGISAALDLLP